MEKKQVFVLLACLAVAGCMPHIKARDSYGAMFKEGQPSGFADPYAYGGISEASGGTLVSRVPEKSAADSKQPAPAMKEATPSEETSPATAPPEGQRATPEEDPLPGNSAPTTPDQ